LREIRGRAPGWRCDRRGGLTSSPRLPAGHWRGSTGVLRREQQALCAIGSLSPSAASFLRYAPTGSNSIEPNTLSTIEMPASQRSDDVRIIPECRSASMRNERSASRNPHCRHTPISLLFGPYFRLIRLKQIDLPETNTHARLSYRRVTSYRSRVLPTALACQSHSDSIVCDNPPNRRSIYTPECDWHFMPASFVLWLQVITLAMARPRAFKSGRCRSAESPAATRYG
jgi:hypothetical protein